MPGCPKAHHSGATGVVRDAGPRASQYVGNSVQFRPGFNRVFPRRPSSRVLGHSGGGQNTYGELALAGQFRRASPPF